MDAELAAAVQMLLRKSRRSDVAATDSGSPRQAAGFQRILRNECVRAVTPPRLDAVDVRTFKPYVA
jgi:hypothetical protein